MSKLRECRNVVEAITDFLEHSLDAADAAEIEQHLILCDACADYLKQMQAVSERAALLAEQAPIDPDLKARLLAVFRQGKQGAS